ncbi:hypothetical protein [Microbulbifer thermotolerans]|uniref:hypothetical protein n=1 Tax=Microbulbifer thermotolerans TaxID=252514 RepID=UPI0022498316|nr:hypothetical protein [Microbulbifer thermotolerans]MCX2779118.1 hypothetical protein [Microbulbifer thermotolerans]MCX2795650.1 hypothetical protein [Microbulbifer thermotolerans]MCX2805250.1 hypothetical protein [Microbulbifer thermotolerans]MCX2830345.1 hypothetical protein [Microbulbifer thermotolerans]MCX2835121.1 hypothetical protein [Microbulbifer thermotolerans]
MNDLVHKLLFSSSIIFSAITGVYISSKAEHFLGSPWHILILFVSALTTHIFINGFFLNKLIFSRKMKENTPVFELTENGATFGFPKASKEEIIWSNVSKIEIVTSDEGPWSEDLWWVIFQEDCEEPTLMPGGTENINAIFNVLETQFSGASMENIIKAMGSTSNAKFAVWEK